MSARSRGPRILLATFAVVAIVALARTAFAPATDAAHETPATAVPTEAQAPIVRAAMPEIAPLAPAMPAPRVASERPVAASDDPCARPDHEDPPVTRPSITAVLEARQGELAARYAALSEDASTELREGLRSTAARGDPERAIDLLVRAPDRAAQGFDHAAAAALYVALTAMNEGRVADARRWASRSAALDRADPAGPVLASIVAEQSGDHDAARAALADAFARDRDDPAIAWQLAMRLADTESIADAVGALDAYLEAIPEDAAARRLRTRLERQAEALEHTTRRALRGVVIRAPVEVDAAEVDRALAIVDEALDASARWTGTARPRELLVIVHHDREAMRRATCSPSWSGAIFDGILHTDRETLAREEVARRTLRHEALHAQLHAERRTVLPYWLDEGLAQRFSGEEGADHHRSWALMVRERVVIPFESIEGPFMEIDDPRDARLAYHQSLGILRYLEHAHGARAVSDVIALADRGVTPAGLLAAIAPELDRERLLAFLAPVE